MCIRLFNKNLAIADRARVSTRAIKVFGNC